MNPGLRRAFEKGLACCNECRPTIEMLEKLAEVAPEWKGRVEELRSKLDHHTELCEMGIQLDEATKG